MKIIERTRYLEKMKRANQTPDIKVITGEKTFAREVDPLLKIKDAYPKVLIARTKHNEYQYEGIKIIDVTDWLLNS